MRIRVERKWMDDEVTLSKVFIDGVFVCFGIEDPIRSVKVKGKTGIPSGQYKLGMRYSPSFSPKYKHDMLWVKDVPGFEYILIHPGNTVEDTDGCLLLGSKLGVVNNRIAMVASMAAYNKFYGMVAGAVKKGDVVIDYVNY